MSFKTAPAANMAEIAAMVERREVGYSLESAFYASQEVYDLDMKAIFGEHWIFVASEAEIPEPGDFVTVEIDTQSLIIVRDDDDDSRKNEAEPPSPTMNEAGDTEVGSGNGSNPSTAPPSSDESPPADQASGGGVAAPDSLFAGLDRAVPRVSVQQIDVTD